MIILLLISACSKAEDYGAKAFENKDYIKAYALSVKGCKDKNGEACYILANIYNGGLARQQDQLEAARYYIKACDIGNGRACYMVGKLYSKSNIVQQDKDQSESYFRKSNKILIKKVDKIVCCYQKAYQDFPRDKTLLLGNPRASVICHEVPHEIHDKYHLDKNKKLVTIVMGSLGSKSVNDTMKSAMNQFMGKNYQVLYVTGKPYYEEMKQYENENVRIVPYIDDMPSVMHATDLIVSRAGASTLAELTALGLPAVLIPSPYVAKNHQEYNALELVNSHAAKMIAESKLQADNLISVIDSIINDETALNILKDNAKKLGKPNACQDMYNVIMEMLGE